MLPAGAALDQILEHTGYLALAATTPGGVEAGDLLHAVDRVRQVVEEGGSLADAADALEADSEFTNEVESLPLEPGRTDVVRLMNLHKAKGLEADVVFLADPCGGFKPRVDVHIERKGDKALGLVQGREEVGGLRTRRSSSASTRTGNSTRPPRSRISQAEQTRLLYVAATRARQISSSAAGCEGHRLGHSEQCAGQRAVSSRFRPRSVSLRLSRAVSSVEAQADANAARVAAHARVNQPSWSITSVTAEAKHIARMASPAEAAAPDDATKVVAQNTPSHRADAGMAWGTLIHGLLEHAMRHPNATRDDLRRLAMWLTVEEPQLRAVIDEALDTVESVSRAEFWNAAKAAEHFEEAPFAVSDGARVLTNGVIDLLFKSADGWQVRDYKTTVGIEAGAYQQQLETYRAALRAVGCEPVAAEIVHVRTAES